MAASITCRGVLRCVSIVRFGVEQHSVAYIQVRHKQKKTVRYRSPHESKKSQNETWVSRKQVIQTKPKDTRGTDNLIWKRKRPTDDVWIRLYYPKQSLPLEEALSRHMEYAVPEMLDSQTSLVYADVMLNTTTAKKTKFMGQLRSAAHVPHKFDDQQEKRCIVFCETSEEQQRALDMGAVAAGGKDLIQSIQNRDLTLTDFEFALCTPDLLPQLIPIRNVLKDRFPILQKGNLSPNIEEMMLYFDRAVSYTSQKVADGVGRLQVPFGQLDMPLEHLVENFRELMTAVSSHRPPKLGPMVTKVQIVCPPSEERFTLRLHGYVPGYDEDTPPVLQEVEGEEEEEGMEKAEDSDDDQEEVAAKR